MASKTYRVRVLVLRKTKLGEKDLIVTMLDETGMLVKGVAKGARKPGGSLAARLELFSEAIVLMAQGRSLDVVCEAKLVNASSGIARDLERSSCAAPLCELLCNIAQPDLQQPRVFDISKAALDLMGSSNVGAPACLALCAASLWKVMAQIGFRPSFSNCVQCGTEVDDIQEGELQVLSISEGGVICDSCRRPSDAVFEKLNVIKWCNALIMMRFSDVVISGIDQGTCMDVLHLARLWSRAHTGRDLKSLDFLFTAGLFPG